MIKFKFTLIVCCSIFLFSCTASGNKKTNNTKPNIIWIIVEDLSPDLACYGNSIVQTPTLDELAELGTKFTNAYATGPACSPSRTALAVGYYQNAIGAHHMRYPKELLPELSKGVIPMHILLNENGFQTANIKTGPGNGKTDWLFSFDTDTYEFDQWDEIDKTKPFFARINLGLTHRGFVRDKEYPLDYTKVEVPPYYPDHAVSKKDWRNYYESIQVLDRQIASVLKDVKSRELDKNTLIFFFSDHGRPMTRGKNFLYDSGIKVPLIVASFDEQIRKTYLSKKVNDQLVSLIDVNASTLALSNIDYKSQGQAFFGTKNRSERDFVYASADRMGEIEFKSRTVRSKNFKYIRNYRQHISVNSGSTYYRKSNHPIYHLLNILDEKDQLDKHQKKLLQNLEYEELYDLKKDPFEIYNLAQQPEWNSKLIEMSEHLDTWMSTIDDKGLKMDSKEIIEAFKKYGEDGKKSRTKSIEGLRNSVINQVEN